MSLASQIPLAIPGYPNNHNGFQMEGKTAEQTYLMQVNWADYDYLKTYGIPTGERQVLLP